MAICAVIVCPQNSSVRCEDPAGLLDRGLAQRHIWGPVSKCTVLGTSSIISLICKSVTCCCVSTATSTEHRLENRGWLGEVRTLHAGALCKDDTSKYPAVVLLFLFCCYLNALTFANSISWLTDMHQGLRKKLHPGLSSTHFLLGLMS